MQLSFDENVYQIRHIFFHKTGRLTLAFNSLTQAGHMCGRDTKTSIIRFYSCFHFGSLIAFQNAIIRLYII